MDDKLWALLMLAAADLEEGAGAQALREVAELFRERNIDDMDELRDQLGRTRGW